MSWNPGVASLMVGALLTLPLSGCAADASDAQDDGDAEEIGATEDEIKVATQKLVGTFEPPPGAAGHLPPTFRSLLLAKDGKFAASIDTGVRCVMAPCQSREQLTGRFTATSSLLHLSPNAGEQKSSYHGRFSYKLSAGKLRLTRSGADWSGWTNELAKQ